MWKTEVPQEKGSYQIWSTPERGVIQSIKGRSPPTPPGVQQGAHRVQDEMEENINSDANNSNNDSVTSYSASIASVALLSSLSSFLLAPH